MSTHSKHLFQAAGLAIVLFALATPWAAAQSSSEPPTVNQDILAEVQSLYGLSEDQAIKRLAREVDAGELERLIKALDISSYAGSWFDDQTWKLVVAISDPKDRALVEGLGATPVLVSHSLNELEAARSLAESSLASSLTAAGTVRATYVDYELNRVVIGVKPGKVSKVQSVLDLSGLDLDLIQVIEEPRTFTLSAAVRGANGTRNYTWNQQFGGEWPCSIGASIEGGYVTAGHCGQKFNQMRTPSGQSLGTVAGSTLTDQGLAFEEDGAWVDTVAGWTPQPQVNGYNDGIISINAEWAGMLEAPINTTVCRYGQTSGGPDCGQVEQKDQRRFFGPEYGYVDGLTTTSNICTFDGDSGGPYLMATGQMQGTNTGGSDTNVCPVPSDAETVFQPIMTTLMRFQRNSEPLVMLTTHGAVKPTINGFDCPSFNETGSYLCSIDSYNSQGITDILWSSNTGHSSTTALLSGTCSDGQTVSVTLDVSNPYGTRTINDSFTCNGGPPQ